MGIPEPCVSSTDPMDLILSEAEDVLSGEPVDKCLIYAPDNILKILPLVSIPLLNGYYLLTYTCISFSTISCPVISLE